MTSNAVLRDLLNRLSVRQGSTIHIGSDELDSWPAASVAALQAVRILVKAQPALSIECPGCERHCFKPVEIIPADDSRPARIFVFCDQPEDLGQIPVKRYALERWQTTGDLLADALNRALNITSRPRRDHGGTRWRLGVLKGMRRTADVILAFDDCAVLLVENHSIPLMQIVSLDNDTLSANSGALIELLDRPSDESPAERRERVERRIQEVKAQGVRNFLQQVAREENISASRLKQLRPSRSPKPKATPR